ncbi:hypothetical protein RHSIM_Rhsim03G0261700 [Rhododendron simsii]|uniref:Protein kinase domain-containing protein n=1 Tax=Rhododendron simsii TaxID=118357 RepID=A0A834H8G7_RHOSS|nr:hypothetical protein RHSIM_Rhsim03G0261700 [Rhododendron simsii]
MAVKSAELFDSGSLQMEKQLLSLLHRTNKCPYIIKCFGDEYTTGKNVYNLSLEYASGGSLLDLIRKSHGSGLPESDLLTTKKVWARKAYWSTDEFVHKIGHVFGTPEIPSGISEEGKEFLKGCFQRRTADRLTVDMLLKLPFVSDLDDGGNIEIEAEESEPVQVMDENYDEERDENLDIQMPKNSEIVPNVEIENDLFLCSSDTKPRLVAEEDPSMHDDSNLIEPIFEDEPSVVYLDTLTNHEKRSPSSDETIRNCNPSMCSSDTKTRLVVEEDHSMCSSDEEPNIEVYFDKDVEVEPTEDEEEGSPRHV